MNGRKAPVRAVAMIALLLAISLLLTACGDTGKAEEVVKTFFSCVKAGDIDGAISCYTPEFQQSWQACISPRDCSACSASATAPR